LGIAVGSRFTVCVVHVGGSSAAAVGGGGTITFVGGGGTHLMRVTRAAFQYRKKNEVVAMALAILWFSICF
jgi:hypothetical protein